MLPPSVWRHVLRGAICFETLARSANFNHKEEHEDTSEDELDEIEAPGSAETYQKILCSYFGFPHRPEARLVPTYQSCERLRSTAMEAALVRIRSKHGQRCPG